MDYAITVEAWTSADAAAAWATIMDFRALPRWHPTVRWLRPERGVASLAPGARWVECAGRGPFRATFRLTVRERAPERRFTWDARYLGVRGRHTWEIQPRPDGCVLIDRETFAAPWPLLLPARALLGLFRIPVMNRAAIQGWAREAERRREPGGGPGC